MPKDIDVVRASSNAPDGSPPKDDCASGTASKGRSSPPEENFARRAFNRLLRKRLIAQKLPNAIEPATVGHPSQDQDRGVSASSTSAERSTFSSSSTLTGSTVAGPGVPASWAAATEAFKTTIARSSAANADVLKSSFIHIPDSKDTAPQAVYASTAQYMA